MCDKIRQTCVTKFDKKRQIKNKELVLLEQLFCKIENRHRTSTSTKKF